MVDLFKDNDLLFVDQILEKALDWAPSPSCPSSSLKKAYYRWFSDYLGGFIDNNKILNESVRNALTSWLKDAERERALKEFGAYPTVARVLRVEETYTSMEIDSPLITHFKPESNNGLGSFVVKKEQKNQEPAQLPVKQFSYREQRVKREAERKASQDLRKSSGSVGNYEPSRTPLRRSSGNHSSRNDDSNLSPLVSPSKILSEHEKLETQRSIAKKPGKTQMLSAEEERKIARSPIRRATSKHVGKSDFRRRYGL